MTTLTEPWLATRLAVLKDADPALISRGRFLTATVLLEVGAERCAIDIEDGRVVALRPDPLVMPSCTFGIRVEREDWEQFWTPLPPPGRHDLFALLKRKRLTFYGNLAPLMANLLYVKELLALPRASAAGSNGRAAS